MIPAIRRTAVATALAVVLSSATAAAQKPGGILKMYSLDSPPSMSIHEETAATAEQASKRTMCRPTRQWNRGRLIRLGETSEEYTQLLHRGSGGSMYTRKARATRETPMRDQG